MTTKEYIASLQKAITEIKSGEALQRAAQSVHNDRVLRIFDVGSVARGYNSTKPVWIENKYVRNSQNKGKTGRAEKTSYFKSYKAFKGAIGMGTDVNFRVTNDLQMDFANSRINPNSGKPDTGTVIKVSNELFVEEIRSSENMDKLKGNIARFGDFIAFTSAEKKKFETILQQELIATLRGER